MEIWPNEVCDNLQELTECQNVSKHAINTTLMALTAQL